MPHEDVSTLRDRVAAAERELADINAQFSAIAARRNAAQSEEQRLECSRAAGRVAAGRAGAERRVTEAKRALAQAQGDEYHQG